MAGASATVAVRDASGRDLGTLTLSDAAGGISVSGRLTGLAPGEHGMHLHMTGRCDAPTFDSAGIAELEEVTGKPIRLQSEALYAPDQFDVVLM
jgi:Cu/Zn superoxide dismutase